jgi:hypothetical protein
LWVQCAGLVLKCATASGRNGRRSEADAVVVARAGGYIDASAWDIGRTADAQKNQLDQRSSASRVTSKLPACSHPAATMMAAAAGRAGAMEL